MACGRLQFDRLDDAGRGGDGDAIDADPQQLCAGGDGICRVSCLALGDPDCSTTCGDAVCVGNAGEHCGICTECNTRSVVCGNGQCDPGEDSDICGMDCGPTPWTWTAEEAELVSIANMTRTNGYDCGGGIVIRPALTRLSNLDAGAREWAWENTYQALAAGDSCNGRTFLDRLGAAGAMPTRYAFVYVSPGTPQDAIDFFVSGATGCRDFMATDVTRIGAGTAIINGRTSHVLFTD